MNNLQIKKTLPGKQRGVTFVEIMIGLAIIAIMGGLALKYGGGLFSSAHSKSSGDLVNMIVATSTPLRQPGVGYAGVSDQNIKHFLGDEFISGGQIQNSNGGAVTIAPVTYAGIANNALAMTDPLYPKADCNKTVSAEAVSMISVQVNGTTVKPTNGTLDMTATNTACNNTINTIIWTFK